MNQWNEKYKKQNDVYGNKMEYKLQSIRDKVKHGKVLDIGIGEGRNSLWFAYRGFEVHGLDLSSSAIERLKEQSISENLNIKVKVGDVKTHDFGEEKYNLIICSWVLNFFKQSEVIELLKSLVQLLEDEGYLYIGAFGINDPSYKKCLERENQIEENTFHISSRNSDCFFFTKEFFLEQLEKLTLVSISEEEYVEQTGKRRLRGIIEYIGAK